MPIPDNELVAFLRKATESCGSGKVKTCALILVQTAQMDARVVDVAGKIVEKLLTVHKDVEATYDSCEALVKWYGDSPQVLCKVGAVMLAHEDYSEALDYYRRSAELDPSSGEGWAGIDAATSLCFPRYHFRMLNDQERNRAYKQAIHRAAMRLGGGATAVDIGAGTGLLSLYASEAGCRVTAFESDPVMAEVAHAVLEGSGVQLVEEHTTDIDLPAAQLVVTEIFDCAVFGEGVIETLRHLQASLGSGYCAVPQRAQLWGWVVESNEVLTELFLVLSNVCGARLPAVVGGCELEEGRSGWEPYHAVDLRKLRKQPTPLSEPVCISTLDMATGAHDTAMSSFRISAPGVGCAIMTNMVLDLGEGLTYTTATPDSCWDHAAFPLQGPTQVAPGDTLQVPFVVGETIATAMPVAKAQMATYDEVRRLNDERFWNIAAAEVRRDAVALVVSTGLCWYPAILSKMGVDFVVHGDSDWAVACVEANGPGAVVGHSEGKIPQVAYGCVVQPNGLLRGIDVVRGFREAGGETVPSDVGIVCFLMESCQLVADSVVADSNTLCAASIAGAINGYSSRVVAGLDLATLPHRALSVHTPPSTIYAGHHRHTLTATAHGTLHAVPFYFTFSSVTTLDGYHFRVAAELLPTPIPLAPGDIITLSILVDHDTVRITAEKH